MKKKDIERIELRIKHWEQKRDECRAQDNHNGAEACTQVIHELQEQLEGGAS